jgi:hypothetical protein
MGDLIDFAGRRRPTVTDDEGEGEVATDFATLAADLRLASQEIQEADCPGNINSDIPALVLTDLAALTLDQWEEHSPPLSRAELLATICGGLAYMLEWFQGSAEEGERKQLRAATRALDALTREDLRPRLGKV